MRLSDFNAMYRDMATSSPQMARGRVWCYSCGKTQSVDSAECLRRGWPVCCGVTMSISSPDEKTA